MKRIRAHFAYNNVVYTSTSKKYANANTNEQIRILIKM